MSRRNLVATLALAALAGCSSGETKPEAAKRRVVADADVPKPILDSFAKSYPTGKTLGWSERKNVYKARAQDSGKWLEVSFEASGAIKEASCQEAVDSAPAAVKTAFAASPYAKMTFVDGVRKTVPGNDAGTLNKFILKDGDKVVIAVYDDSGKLVKEKPFAKEKLEKWQGEHSVAR